MEFTDRDQLHKIPVEISLIPGRDQYIVSPISLLYRQYIAEAANFNPRPFAYAHVYRLSGSGGPTKVKPTYIFVSKI